MNPKPVMYNTNIFISSPDCITYDPFGIKAELNKNLSG